MDRFFSTDASSRKKIPITGGAPVTIADITNPFGATWDAGDRIVVGQGSLGIVRMSANGGAVEAIVKTETDEVPTVRRCFPVATTCCTP